MNWTDTRDIAIALDEKFELNQEEILKIRFTDLQSWVMQLEGFVGEKEKCNEKTLEAIQMTWLEECE